MTIPSHCSRQGLPSGGSLRGTALRWTIALFLGALACDMPVAEVADEGDDALWVGVTSDSDGPGTFLLTPIARREGDQWSVAWPEPWYDVQIAVAVDSAGRIDPEAVIGALPLDMSNPRLPRIAAPRRWTHPDYPLAESLDRSQDAAPLRVTGLALRPAYCGTMWRLQVHDEAGHEEPETTLASLMKPKASVSFSRRPDEVLRESEVAGLLKIPLRLGYERRPSAGEMYRDFSWLGLFRFDTTVLGVLQYRGYEGSSYDVVELDGDDSRIVTSAHQGGC